MAVKPLTSFRSDWFLKTFAGIFFGLAISYGIVAFFVWFGADGLLKEVKDSTVVWRSQFSMWMISPIWLCILSGVYGFRSGLQACKILGAICTAVYLAFFIARSII